MMEGQKFASYLTGTDLIQRIFDIMADNHKFTWFAHNAQYELRYFIDALLDHKEHVKLYCRTDSEIFMVTIKLPDYDEKAVLVIRDSMAIWPASLRKMLDTFCPELPKLTIDFETTRFDPSNPEHVEYSKRDSEGLLHALIRYNEMVKEIFDVNLRATTASTALASWCRTLDGDERYYNSKDHEDFIRSAYFGGLVFLTDTRRYDDCNTYDINSSYAYTMKTFEVPIGNPVKSNLFAARYPGIYRVTVRAPNDLIVPILPKRHNKSVVWPRGTFETTVTSEELKFATANGYRVLKIHDGRIWQQSFNPFVEFIEKCEGIRLRNPGTALSEVAKRMQNSCYGKFGSKRMRRKIFANLTDEETIGAVPWGDFWIKEVYSEDMQCLPVWAVFITARARLHLLSKVYEIGPANVLYGDTDSLTLKSGYTIAQSKDYGGWKLEKAWTSFRARGPKVYAGMLDGRYKGAAKGIPKKQWERSGIFHVILDGQEGEPVTYKVLEKFVTALKTREIGEHAARRTVSVLSHSKSWQAEPDGTVRPRLWSDIERADIEKASRKGHRKRLRAA
jgi:hypothetical protein